MEGGGVTSHFWDFARDSTIVFVLKPAKPEIHSEIGAQKSSQGTVTFFNSQFLKLSYALG